MKFAAMEGPMKTLMILLLDIDWADEREHKQVLVSIFRIC